MIRFGVITEKDLKDFIPFAEKIWKEHYYTCVDKGLTDYVFELFLSEESVKSQLSEGSRYYYAIEDETGNRAGFFSIYPKEGMMYLSKLYIKKEYRRKGFSGKILEFIKSEAKKEDLHEIFLNVNRNNTGSIEAYRHLGFHVAEETVSDVGEGFICEDYIMKMTI